MTPLTASLGFPKALLVDLERFLQDTYGIESQPPEFDLRLAIERAYDAKTAREVEDLIVAHSGDEGEAKRQADERLYDLISDEPLLGLVQSMRWPLIFDTGAWLTALMQRNGAPSGPFLDLGCHAGYHALWLAHTLKLRGRGLDNSPAAVSKAKQIAARHGSDPEQLVFDTGPVTSKAPAGGYGLIYSALGPLTLTSTSLSTVTRLLAPDGIIVWIGHCGDLGAGKVREVFSEVGLRLVYADIVGGLVNGEIVAKTVLVASKGEDPCVPDNLIAASEATWRGGFSAYCDEPGRSPSRKTLCWYRSEPNPDE